MELYHGTTDRRSKKILLDGCIKKDVERYFTKDKNGDGYTTQGYVYLSNEVTFSLHFAICHNIIDKTKELYVFRVHIPDELVEPDYDELRHQLATPNEIAFYGGHLKCSLLEYKACRVPFDIKFETFKCSYFSIDALGLPNPEDLIDNVGRNYEYVTKNYTKAQREFIEKIQWKRL